MRLRMRKNVDLPQPDGPISAVTLPGSMVSETRSSTLCVPNHAEMPRASRPTRRFGANRGSPGRPYSSTAVSACLGVMIGSPSPSPGRELPSAADG